MNRKQRRITQSQGKYKTVIHFRGRSYTIEEAVVLAVKEKNLGNAQTAIDIYHLILAQVPDHVDTYNNLGVALQILQRYDEALVNCDKAIALKPDYALVYNNRAITLQALKRYDEALASCDKAIALNPDYVAAYNNRIIVLHALKRYDEALVSCDKVLTLNPNDAMIYYNRGITLQELKRSDDALASYSKAIALKPDYAQAYNNQGAILRKLKRYDDALASYSKAITLKPEHFDAYNNLGRVLADKGDMQEAEKMFRKALAIKPDFASPLFGLVGIRKYQETDIKTIQTVLNNPDIVLRDKEYLNFALGNIFDERRLYDEAFEYYRQANQLRNTEVYYNPDKVIATTNNIIEVFSKKFLARGFSFASDSRSPIFVVGMPRSGTTLMASILSNHRSIETAGELPTIIELTARLQGVPYPQAVKHFTPAIASCLINEYEERLRRDIGSGVPHIVDKHPLNFKHVGFISMLFPNARIIHCMRDPMDTCLSNYFQCFALDYDYSFDLRNIGHFYGEYARIMGHWRKALPTKMIEISYQDTVMNTEQTVRKILDFIRLEWDERCLVPHTNTSAVETASKWQVRQPIYKQSVERWRHYEKHLTPLKEVLQRTRQLPV